MMTSSKGPTLLLWSLQRPETTGSSLQVAEVHRANRERGELASTWHRASDRISTSLSSPVACRATQESAF
jgi:hypothetical protein